MCANDCAHNLSNLLIYNNLAVAYDIHAIGHALDGIGGVSSCTTSSELKACEGIYLDGNIGDIGIRGYGGDAGSGHIAKETCYDVIISALVIIQVCGLGTAIH